MCLNDIHDVVNDIHELIETNLQCDEQSFRLIYKAETFNIDENGPCLTWVGCSHIVLAGNAGECVSAPTRIGLSLPLIATTASDRCNRNWCHLSQE